jgi:hypothetical protein
MSFLFYLLTFSFPEIQFDFFQDFYIFVRSLFYIMHCLPYFISCLCVFSWNSFKCIFTTSLILFIILMITSLKSTSLTVSITVELMTFRSHVALYFYIEIWGQVASFNHWFNISVPVFSGFR